MLNVQDCAEQYQHLGRGSRARGSVAVYQSFKANPPTGSPGLSTQSRMTGPVHGREKGEHSLRSGSRSWGLHCIWGGVFIGGMQAQLLLKLGQWSDMMDCTGRGP